MPLASTLTIGGTPYTASGRSAQRARVVSLSRSIDGYDTLEFVQAARGATPLWSRGDAVTLDTDDGGGPVLRFSGVVTDIAWQQGPTGWALAYTAQSLRAQADNVPVSASDGTGTVVFNRTPNDQYYLSSEAGLDVGTILTRLLTVQATADALDAIGVGGYTSLSPPTLPATTTTSFALLTVVPPSPCHFTGPILSLLTQFLERWHPKFVLELRPDGVLVAKDTTDPATFVPATVTLGSNSGVGTLGAHWPSVRSTTAACKTRVVIRGGPEVEAALLSTADGTLTRGWSGGEESAWTLYDFTQPKGFVSTGAITGITGNTATIDPTDALAAWVSNYWATAEADIEMRDSVAAGIAQSQRRRVTANSAVSAGGTGTVTWDSSWPVDSTSYDTYRLIGRATGNVDVGRLYLVREPHGGATGTSTYIGSHLVKRSPIAVRWANNEKTLELYFTTGSVEGGSVPTTVPADVEPVPSLGGFRFTQPTVTFHGNPTTLNSGWPADVAHGLPSDVQVLALYSRGALSVAVPADIAGVPQYEGTAFTVDGLEETAYIEVPSWIWKNDLAQMTTLAQEHLDAMKDIVFEGSQTYSVLPAWDFLSFGTSLNIAISGLASPWSAMNAPIRSVRLDWPGAGAGTTHRVTVQFSTRRKAFTADELYVPVAFAHGSPLSQIGQDSPNQGNYRQWGAAVRGGLIDTSFAGNRAIASAMPDNSLASIPTSLAQLGIPTNMAQLGIPTTPGQLGIPTSMDQVLGRGTTSAIAQAGMDVGAGIQDTGRREGIRAITPSVTPPAERVAAQERERQRANIERPIQLEAARQAGTDRAIAESSRAAGEREEIDARNQWAGEAGRYEAGEASMERMDREIADLEGIKRRDDRLTGEGGMGPAEATPAAPETTPAFVGPPDVERERRRIQGGG